MTTGTPLRGLMRVAVDDVHPNPRNPREKLTGIDELALSIRENGLIQPIVCQQVPGTGLVVLAGHRRLAAVKRLGWTEVTVLIRRDMLPDEELLAMLVENGQRANLDPIEEARAIRQLLSSGLTQLQVAQKIGRSPLHVNQRLLLLSLPVEDQEQLRAGVETIGSSVEKAKIATGRVGTGKGSRNPGWHFGNTHPLAALARGRCTRLGHSKKRRLSGAVACAECWESVVRADERRHLHEHSAITGSCALCSSTYGEATA